MTLRRLASAIACLAFMAAASCAVAAPVAWRFDAAHTQVLFDVDHAGFSTAHGRLRVKDGGFVFDPQDWSRAQVEVVVDMAGVDLGDARLDAAARSRMLLDTARWPTARYVSQRVEARDARHAIVHGQLHWRGVTRPLELAVTLNRLAWDPYSLQRKVGFTATATLVREDFDITRDAAAIGGTVALRIEVEGVRARHATQPETPDDTQE